MSGDKTREQRLVDSTGGASLAGSTSRSESLGVGDPRHRRGPQAETMANLRFDLSHFQIDSNQRLQLKNTVTISPQMACIPGSDSAISSTDINTYEKLDLLAAASSVGARYIAVSASGDTVALKGGSVYRVDAEYEFASSATADASLKVQSSAGTSYGSRTFEVSGEAGESRTATITAAVDLRNAGGIELQIMTSASNAGISALNGWVTVQRIG